MQILTSKISGYETSLKLFLKRKQNPASRTIHAVLKLLWIFLLQLLAYKIKPCACKKKAYFTNPKDLYNSLLRAPDALALRCPCPIGARGIRAKLGTPLLLPLMPYKALLCTPPIGGQVDTPVMPPTCPLRGQWAMGNGKGRTKRSFVRLCL